MKIPYIHVIIIPRDAWGISMDKAVVNGKQIESVKLLRSISKLNQRQMAEYFGIPLRTWEDWESGRRKMPEYLLRLMQYKVRLDFGEDGYQRKNNAVSIIYDCDGNRIVLINDLRFKGRKNVDWRMVEACLKEYIGQCEEIVETLDLVYVSTDFPDEFCHSKDTKTLKGANLYAKANTIPGIKEMIRIASNKSFSENYDTKHKSNAKYGWYRYDTRFALPKYNSDNELDGYNIFKARLVVRHAEDGKLYLYDILRTKKETSKPLER